MSKSFVITKWCAAITDSGKDEIKNIEHDDMPFEFRLLDDDGEVYACGYSKTNDDEAAFIPLDCYMDSYGVTSIEYKNPVTGEYEML